MEAQRDKKTKPTKKQTTEKSVRHVGHNKKSLTCV